VRCRPSAVTVVIFLAVIAGAANAAEQRYATRLTAVAYDGAMRANVQGDGQVSATLDGNKLTVSGRFMTLPSSATNAKLYSGAGIGVPGGPILDLQLNGQADGALSGSFTLTASSLRRCVRVMSMCSSTVRRRPRVTSGAGCCPNIHSPARICRKWDMVSCLKWMCREIGSRNKPCKQRSACAGWHGSR